MARKTKIELQELKDKHGVDRLWSWSKINCFSTSKFEYYLKYIAKTKEDRDNSAYAPYGTLCHQILEDFYSKTISYDEMVQEFEDGVFTLNISDLKFDRNDEDKNAALQQKYTYNLEHFFRSHIPITRKVLLEQFLVIKINESVFQGYIDCMFKDEDGVYHIIDFKTSSIYKGEKVKKESGQLILYAMGLHQMGVPLNKIKICWNFLKYTNVNVEQANGSVVVRQIERSAIGKSLKSNCLMWLKKLGYKDTADDYIELLTSTNNIKCLPEDVQQKYSFDDCYVYCDFDEQVFSDMEIKIDKIISDIKDHETKYATTKDEKVFYDDLECVKKESFYFSNLCSYSPTLHKPYGLYLEEYNSNKNNNGLYSVVGSGISEANDENDDDDLDWLNAI